MTVEGEDSYLLNVYQRFPITVERGDGATIWDADGKKYIDCMGGYGVGIIGYSNKKVIAEIEEQLKKIMVCHMSVYNNCRLRFLRKLTDIAPPDVTKIFFSNSGAESVEAALKFARKYSQKPGIISMYGGYHGKTFGALSVTHNEKYRKSFVPLLDHIKFIPYGNVGSLIDAIDEKTGTVILEPIQGETGIILPPDGFLNSVRKICDERNIVLIFDEIQTGGLLAAAGAGPKMLQDHLIAVLSRNASAVMTNVPGPPQPLYFAGGRIAQLMFWVPQAGAIGMGVSILSYDGAVQFGLITDRGLCPDPEHIIAHFGPEFEKLLLTTLLAPWPREGELDPALAERSVGAA
jgi:hypothetical protein